MENINIPATRKSEGKPSKRVILLEDLDIEEEIVGGADQKLFFGENPDLPSPFAGLFNTTGNSGKGT